ncbi:hypothetical protein GCM10009654_12960 [Streptomyces hebeiensis]|uniref:Lipoprotein n=1 Tax=Streptomyces hebeiensis TaxID=229486 RepID=A0ABN1UMU4_9ACTN
MGRTGPARGTSRGAATRRGALIALGAGLLTACSSADTSGRDGTAEAARAEEALRRRSANTSRELLRQYDAVLARHPGERARLTPLRTAVARQVTALTPPHSTAPSPSASAGTAAVAADPGRALRALAAAERGTADRHTAALVDAPPELARLLASVAAAGAAHAYLLTEGFGS